MTEPNMWGDVDLSSPVPRAGVRGWRRTWRAGRVVEPGMQPLDLIGQWLQVNLARGPMGDDNPDSFYIAAGCYLAGGMTDATIAVTRGHAWRAVASALLAPGRMEHTPQDTTIDDLDRDLAEHIGPLTRDDTMPGGQIYVGVEDADAHAKLSRVAEYHGMIGPRSAEQQAEVGQLMIDGGLPFWEGLNKGQPPPDDWEPRTPREDLLAALITGWLDRSGATIWYLDTLPAIIAVMRPGQTYKSTGGPELYILLPTTPDMAPPDTSAFAALGAARNVANRAAGYYDPILETPLRAWDDGDDEQKSAAGRPPASPIESRPPLGPTILFPAGSRSGQVHRLVPSAIASMPAWDAGADRTRPDNGRWKSYAMKDGTAVTFALPEGDYSESAYRILADRRALAILVHYGLFAVWYQCRPKPGEKVTLVMDDFCADIGYARASSGGFKLDVKREVFQMLHCLARVECSVSIPLRNNRTRTLSGPLWDRGVSAIEHDTYTDLFGLQRVGEAADWEPGTFRYGPGDWFTDPEWNARFLAFGKASVGFLTLRPNTDPWAILIGGQVLPVMRANKYQRRVLTVRTLVNYATGGRADAEAYSGHKAQTLGKVKHALDRLHMTGVIGKPEKCDIDEPAEDLDTDDLDRAGEAAAIAAYYADQPGRPDWMSARYAITSPDEEDGARIEALQSGHIQSARVLPVPRRGPGRPKGSKNRPKASPAPQITPRDYGTGR